MKLRKSVFPPPCVIDGRSAWRRTASPASRLPKLLVDFYIFRFISQPLRRGRCSCPNVRSLQISWNKLGENVGKVKHFVLRGAEKKERNEWKSQQSFSKQDNLSLISYLLNESTREQQLYVSLISFPRTRSVFYPLGSLTAKTNPQQHRMLTSLSSPSFILWIQLRLPWCNNPTRQYASLVLALINWDGGAWGWRGVHVVSSFAVIMLAPHKAANRPEAVFSCISRQLTWEMFIFNSVEGCGFIFHDARSRS